MRAVAPRNSISVAMLCVNASLVCDSLSEWAPLCDYRISLCSAREAGSIGASAADRYAFCVTLFAGVWEALPHAPLILKPNGHPWYYDTALSGGVGGKANTRIGNQTATWQGSNIIAGPKGLIPGEEIFVPYTHGSSYILTADDIDDRREHWYYVAKGRKITNSVPTPRVSSTPAPPRGGEGGNHHAGARVFQHVVGVSAPT